jgi:hypothetical protein
MVISGICRQSSRPLSCTSPAASASRTTEAGKRYGIWRLWIAIIETAPSELGLPMTEVTLAFWIIRRPENFTVTSTRSPSRASPRSPLSMRISLVLRSMGTSRAPFSSSRTIPIWPRRGLSRIFMGFAV